MPIHKALHIIILFFFTFLISCDEPQETPEPKKPNSYLKNTTYIDQVSKSTLTLLAQSSGFGDLTSLIAYDVDVYTIEYDITINEETIRASGVIAVPANTKNKLPLLIANHGTISNHNEAPSVNPTRSELVLMASAGYYTFIPDYIGFGSSTEYLHPYYVDEYMSQTIIDGIYASLEFADDQKVKLNNRKFIFGYSEGGYATMSALRATQAIEDIKITATTAGAGGYNLETVTDIILSQDVYLSPSYLAYIIYSYHTYYDLDVELSYFFKAPYSNTIPSLFNGSNSMGTINNQLPIQLEDLFDESFLLAIKNKTETVLLPLLRENSVQNWSPENPLQLYHGTSDIIVPFQDSQTTFDVMVNNNVKNLEFYPIQDKGHGTALPDMVRAIIPWYKAFNVEF